MPAGSARTARWVRWGHDLVGSGVKHLNDLGSDELLGRDMKAVGVASDGLKQPGSRMAPVLAARVVAEAGVSSRPRICCMISLGVRGASVSGRMMLWGSPSPTTCR